MNPTTRWLLASALCVGCSGTEPSPVTDHDAGSTPTDTGTERPEDLGHAPFDARDVGPDDRDDAAQDAPPSDARDAAVPSDVTADDVVPVPDVRPAQDVSPDTPFDAASDVPLDAGRDVVDATAARDVPIDTPRDAPGDRPADATDAPPGRSCRAEDLRFAWPLGGRDAAEWVINNYVDLDPGPGVRDYRGGDRSYNGHQGVDIDAPTFRAMDDGFPVFAAADGVVEATDDVHFDRNLTCSGAWNFVRVRHANGFASTYGHLRRASVVVRAGDRVTAGQRLAVIGSSGCSTAPHLHFEVSGCDDATVDPFLRGMWTAPPVYDTPLGLMDVVLRDGSLATAGDIIDPGANASRIAVGRTLGLGVSVGGGGPGDRVGVDLRAPDRSLFASFALTFDRRHRHSYWLWNAALASATPGQWVAEFRAGGAVARSVPFTVEASSAPRPVVREVLEADYPRAFDDAVRAGLRLAWIDGFDRGGSTFVNALFVPAGGVTWRAVHGLDGAGWQRAWSDAVAAGFRPVQVESYRRGGSARYAGIFEQRSGPAFEAYYARSDSEHAQLFESLRARGFRPVSVSPVEVGGRVEITALYDQASVGSWVAYYGLDGAGYQRRFDEQSAAGLRPVYLNAYSVGTARYFSAIWDATSAGQWSARHDLDGAAWDAETARLATAGQSPRVLTGYDGGGRSHFAGVWTAR